MKKKDLSILFIITFLVSITTFGQSIATYDITFSSVWNSGDHGTLPNNPHWSDLVGATHNDQVTFFEIGEMASLGIKDVAELGHNTQIMGEVSTAITNTYADQWLKQSFSGGALGSATLTNIEVSEDFPLLSLVSMIAPSPDWFIGVNSFSLLDGSNNWKTFVEMDMFPTDAGTDSGANYGSADLVTAPQENISGLQGVFPFNSNKIGTLTITLKSVLNVEEFNNLNKLVISPNPSNGNITIKNIQQLDIKTIEVYNILGKLITNKNIEKGINSVNLYLESKNSGIYLLKFSTTSGESKTKKLLIK